MSKEKKKYERYPNPLEAQLPTQILLLILTGENTTGKLRKYRFLGAYSTIKNALDSLEGKGYIKGGERIHKEIADIDKRETIYEPAIDKIVDALINYQSRLGLLLFCVPEKFPKTIALMRKARFVKDMRMVVRLNEKMQRIIDEEGIAYEKTLGSTREEIDKKEIEILHEKTPPFVVNCFKQFLIGMKTIKGRAKKDFIELTVKEIQFFRQFFYALMFVLLKGRKEIEKRIKDEKEKLYFMRYLNFIESTKALTTKAGIGALFGDKDIKWMNEQLERMLKVYELQKKGHLENIKKFMNSIPDA